MIKAVVSGELFLTHPPPVRTGMTQLRQNKNIKFELE
jgi:hypothetical protein